MQRLLDQYVELCDDNPNGQTYPFFASSVCRSLPLPLHIGHRLPVLLWSSSYIKPESETAPRECSTSSHSECGQTASTHCHPQIGSQLRGSRQSPRPCHALAQRCRPKNVLSARVCATAHTCCSALPGLQMLTELKPIKHASRLNEACVRRVRHKNMGRPCPSHIGFSSVHQEYIHLPPRISSSKEHCADTAVYILRSSKLCTKHKTGSICCILLLSRPTRPHMFWGGAKPSTVTAQVSGCHSCTSSFSPRLFGFQRFWGPFEQIPGI